MFLKVLLTPARSSAGEKEREGRSRGSERRRWSRLLRDFPLTRAHACVRASRGKGSLSIGDYVVRTGATLAGTASASASPL